MNRAFRLMWLFMRVSIQNVTAYRADMYARILMSFLHLAAELVAVWIIFHNTTSIRGWRVPHMLVLVGVYRILAGGIRIWIVPNMRRVLIDIREGTLDFLLLRPVNAQLLASIREFVVWRVADMVLGLAVAAYGCVRLTESFPAAAAGRFVVMMAAAFTIVYSVWLGLATCCFWFVRIQNIEMIFWNVFEAGRFPVVIYRPWVRWMLTYLIPLAFITTFPAASLFGDANSLPSYAPLIALAAAAASLIVSAWFWRIGVRHYSGASA